ncbi:MAG: DUF4124 domain-containing protein [Pseudomonadales bacterium]
MKIATIVSAAALLLCASFAATAATVMYKYTDPQGARVFSYTLPPGQAKHGYERVNLSTGKVEVIAPQLSAEDLALQQRQQQALAACRVELQRIYTLYSAERDIHRAREVSLDALTKSAAQIEADQRQAELELERLQVQAANAERSGQPVTTDLVSAIERRHAQLASLHGQLEQRQHEREQAERRFHRELARFRDGQCPEPEFEALSQAESAR